MVHSLRRRVAAVLVLALAVGALVAPAARAAPGTPAPKAFGWCDGKDPNQFLPALTKVPRRYAGRGVELRYDPKSRCAWGRIIDGQPGDHIWVDRSFDGGRTWQGLLGYNTIRTGSSQYTTAWDDRDVKMRACAGIPGVGNGCTAWY